LRPKQEDPIARAENDGKLNALMARWIM